MKFYLSSHKLGQEPKKFFRLFKKGFKLAYIANSLDHVKDKIWLQRHLLADMAGLEQLGFEVVHLDLKRYFANSESLHSLFRAIDGVWISGGNVFVLRQAMALSGMDKVIERIHGGNSSFVYGGYSAACCVLSPSLKPYQIVDDPWATAYPGIKPIWQGLGLIDFAFMPHFQCRHSESPEIEKEIAYCRLHGIPYKCLRDGEVMVF